MIIVTTPTVANKKIVEECGLVTSSIVQSRHIGKDLISGLKSIIGGELKSYTEMLDESKRTAKERMIQEAMAAGANAIVGFRFALTSSQGTSELIAYGTAVIIE